MAYTIIVSVFVEAKDATDAYKKTVSAMNEARSIPGVSYETTDEWFDNDGEMLMDHEINDAIQKSL